MPDLPIERRNDEVVIKLPAGWLSAPKEGGAVVPLWLDRTNLWTLLRTILAGLVALERETPTAGTEVDPEGRERRATP